MAVHSAPPYLLFTMYEFPLWPVAHARFPRGGQPVIPPTDMEECHKCTEGAPHVGSMSLHAWGSRDLH